MVLSIGVMITDWPFDENTADTLPLKFFAVLFIDAVITDWPSGENTADITDSFPCLSRCCLLTP